MLLVPPYTLGKTKDILEDGGLAGDLAAAGGAILQFSVERWLDRG